MIQNYYDLYAVLGIIMNYEELLGIPKNYLELFRIVRNLLGHQDFLRITMRLI